MIHIKNSVGRTGAILPNPHTNVTGMSVHHDVRWDGMEPHDRQMTPAHGASDGQGHDVEPSLLTSTVSVGPV